MRRRKALAAILAVFLLLTIPMPALAGDGRLSGGLILTREIAVDRPVVTTYTVALDYRLADWWYVDLVVDQHPIHGVDGDVSMTFYLPEWSGKTVYLSIGARAGLWRSTRPPTVYWSIALRF